MQGTSKYDDSLALFRHIVMYMDPFSWCSEKATFSNFFSLYILLYFVYITALKQLSIQVIIIRNII